MNNSFDKIYNPSKDYILPFGTLLYGFSFNGFHPVQSDCDRRLERCVRIDILCYQRIHSRFSYFTINIKIVADRIESVGIKVSDQDIFGVFSLSGSLWLFEQLLQRPADPAQPAVHVDRHRCLCGIGLTGYLQQVEVQGRNGYPWQRSSTNTRTSMERSSSGCSTSSSSAVRTCCSRMSIRSSRFRRDGCRQLTGGHDPELEPMIRTVSHLLTEIR